MRDHSTLDAASAAWQPLINDMNASTTARPELERSRSSSPSDKIATIASACGFEDVSNFNRQFRRRYGSAPGTVRKHGA